jgi:hypothetical protein
VVILKSKESLSWPEYRISLYDHVSMSATCYPLAKPDDDEDVIVITNLQQDNIH